MLPPAICEIGNLYRLSVLDCLDDIVLKIACDFVERPRNYKPIAKEIARKLTDFNSRLGTDPKWPNQQQRQSIFHANFKTPSFTNGTEALQQAAVAYSERVFKTGEIMLRNAFTDEVETLGPYLKSLEGNPLENNLENIDAIFNESVKVLSNENLTGVFGVSKPLDIDWPNEQPFDGLGSFMIEEITRQLNISGMGTIDQKQFITKQRVAYYGALTICAVTNIKDIKDEDEVKNLIDSAYRWEKALSAMEVKESPLVKLAKAG